MRDKTKAKAGALAADVRRATLRLERMVILRRERAMDDERREDRWRAQGDILGRAYALTDAKNRAHRWQTKLGRRWHVIDQALGAANAAITRAFPYYGDLL